MRWFLLFPLLPSSALTLFLLPSYLLLPSSPPPLLSSSPPPLLPSSPLFPIPNRIAFKDFFEDDDELNEAVYFLNLQGTLLHFEDHGLKNVYFLDPQWLAKLMADVISPSSARAGIRNGEGVRV